MKDNIEAKFIGNNKEKGRGMILAPFLRNCCLTDHRYDLSCFLIN